MAGNFTDIAEGTLATPANLNAPLQELSDAIDERTARTEFNIIDYGATGNGVASDLVAINAAITAATTAGGGVVRFPGGYHFRHTSPTSISLPSNISIHAHGAIIEDIGFYTIDGVQNVEYRGGLYQASAANFNGSSVTVDAPIVIYGDNHVVSGVRIIGHFGTGIYLQPSSQRARISDIEIDFFGYTAGMGADSIIVQGAFHTLSNIRIKTDDDGIVFKATDADVPTENISIVGVSVEQAASAIAFGSEVAGAIRICSVSAVSCKGVARPIYIKPGYLSAVYPGGSVEQITINGVSIFDDGEQSTTYGRFVEAITIGCGRECLVREISISDVEARVRGAESSTPIGIHINATSANDRDSGDPDYVRVSTIDGVRISNVRVIDHYDAVAYDGATYFGVALVNGVLIEETTDGVVQNVEINGFTLRGCRQNAVQVSAANGAGVSIGRLDLRTYAQQGTTFSGVEWYSGTTVRKTGDWNITPISSTSMVSPFGTFAGTTLTFDTTPEGSISALPGHLCVSSDGTLYVKESGTTSTGWIAK